jgi:uncharacterized protein
MRKHIGAGVLMLLAAVAYAESVPDARIQTLLEGALAQISVTRFYDPAYRKLAYPGGDVALETGVCTDVIIRAFRQLNIDLQVLVHEDMGKAFAYYPQQWGLKHRDRNIDHRRVPNLQTFFKRQGKALPISQNPADYRPGDVVSWRLANGLAHIGLVSGQLSADGARFLIVHNIGAGAQLEDVLFAFKITGHYRYFP